MPFIWRLGARRSGLNSEKVLIRYRSKQFIKIMEKTELIKEFDVNLFLKLIEEMKMFDGEKNIVSLLNGTEIEVVIE